MTERLYYSDAYQGSFDANVVDLIESPDGPAIVLDRTCFYPTSGGQAHDTGRLGDFRVVDVVAAADGTVRHLVEAEAKELAQLADRSVHGELDWLRRYDHMQQHAGQHLLSGIFHHLFGAETVSVHFGARESTIDLAVPALTAEQMDEAGAFANDMVYRNLPIKSYFVSADELSALPLRRPPKVSGRIRIVEIDGFDYSACGGTHPATTGELGPIKLIRQERRKQQSRLTFLAGRRALADYAAKHRLLVEAAALYSTEIAHVPEMIQRSLLQVKTLQREVGELTERQLVHEVGAMVAAAQTLGEVRVVKDLFTDREVAHVKQMASLLREEAGTVALLGATAGDKLTVIFARSDDIPLHVGNLLRDTLREFGGGGGGRPELAQGGGISSAAGADVLEFALQRLSQELNSPDLA